MLLFPEPLEEGFNKLVIFAGHKNNFTGVSFFNLNKIALFGDFCCRKFFFFFFKVEVSMLEQPQMCEKAKGMRHDRIKGVCYVVTRVSSCKLPLSKPPGDLIVRIHFPSK